MAENEIEIAVPPEAVFAVLADGRRYADWVMGAKEIRAVDPGFPDKGTRFHHTVGVGPMTIEDSTRVVEVDEPRRLVLDAHIGALGSAIITLELQARAGGTHVVMTERAAEGLPAQVAHKVGDVVLRGRNFLSLERLKELAEQGG